MEKIKKEDFLNWAKKADWLLFKEAQTPNGRQEMYVTPMGVLVAAVYSLDGEHVEFAPMVPVIPQQPQGFRMPFLSKG